jgi:hypothetical protein
MLYQMVMDAILAAARDLLARETAMVSVELKVGGIMTWRLSDASSSETFALDFSLPIHGEIGSLEEMLVGARCPLAVSWQT